MKWPRRQRILLAIETGKRWQGAHCIANHAVLCLKFGRGESKGELSIRIIGL